MRARSLVLAASLVGCYSGHHAAYDVNAAWVGKRRVDLVEAWGTPAGVADAGGSHVLKWSQLHHHIDLPQAEVQAFAGRGAFDARFMYSPGTTYTTTTDVTALVDPSDTVVRVDGYSLHWGPPPETNMRWGLVLGAAVGMGMLDDATTPLPSGSAYIGGMSGPKMAIVGMFHMVSGIGDGGGAMGFSWGLGTQWWLATRLAVRAGLALVLDLDPGFADPDLAFGLTGGIGYAIVKTRVFALDLRFDVTASMYGAAFGNFGVGVNLN